MLHSDDLTIASMLRIETDNAMLSEGLTIVESAKDFTPLDEVDDTGLAPRGYVFWWRGVAEAKAALELSRTKGIIDAGEQSHEA